MIQPMKKVKLFLVIEVIFQPKISFCTISPILRSLKNTTKARNDLNLYNYDVVSKTITVNPIL